MLKRSLLIAAAAFACASSPASAQFYKGQVLTLLVNYGVGGNADTEARVYQRHLKKYIPGEPSIIIRNVPGAGGATAMNQLGMNIGSRPDGMTVSYFTTSATQSLIEDPVLKIKIYDFVVISAARGWNLVYARKDIVPGGLQKPSDIVKAKNIFVGGYARGTSHDTRLRMVLEIMGLPYQVVTGFPGTAQLNKAMLQNEVNFTGSSLPGYQTQVIPQIINAGVGMMLFQYPVIGAAGKPEGNPSLEKKGIETFDKVYAEAFGKPPSGIKWDAFLLMNDISSKMQRGVFLPKGSPDEATAVLRKAFDAVGKDPEFIEDYKKVTGEEPELVKADQIEPLFDRMRNLDPQIKQVLKEAVGTE
jgi:tripartite-type tricarboxylate transporter receptor subunit TctC